MRIEDQRTETSWVPAISILEKFQPKLDQKHFIGIKKIILLDEDYHTNDIFNKACGRYVKVPRTKFANIELYFDRFQHLPDAAKQNRQYLSFYILHTLLHELYHHRIRGQKKVRKPKFETEQKKANEWADSTLFPIFSECFPKERYENEWNEIHRKVKEHEHNSVQEIARKIGLTDTMIKEQIKNMPDLPKSPEELTTKKMKRILKKYT
jgi:hypothetical protein